MDEIKEQLRLFLVAWKANDYNKMFALTQKTWQLNHSKKDVKNLFHHRLKKYTITGMTLKESTPLVCDVNLILRLNNQERKVCVRIIKEKMPYKPSDDGEWGINPVSLIKNLY